MYHFQWLDMSGELRQALSSSLIQAWRSGEQGQLLKDSPEDLEDLERLKAGLQRLQEPYEITPGSEKIVHALYPGAGYAQIPPCGSYPPCSQSEGAGICSLYPGPTPPGREVSVRSGGSGPLR